MCTVMEKNQRHYLKPSNEQQSKAEWKLPLIVFLGNWQDRAKPVLKVCKNKRSAV